MLHIVLLGIGLGIALGFPTGPLGILIARRMVLESMTEGFATIAGVLMGDLFYASIILFKLNFIIAWLLQFKTFLELFVVLALLWIGYKTLRDVHTTDHYPHGKAAVATDWFSSFLISLATPQTPLIFTSVYALLNIPSFVSTTPQKLMLLVGISAGVLIWWWGFGAVISALKARGYLKSNRTLFTVFGWLLIVVAAFFCVMSFL